MRIEPVLFNLSIPVLSARISWSAPAPLPVLLPAESSHFPRVSALQNAYSLTCRTFDSGLAEVCHLEGVSLMAYSPLAMGLLTVRRRTTE